MGELIDLATAIRRNDPASQTSANISWNFRTSATWTAATPNTSPGVWNHSCEPNCYLHTEGMKAFVMARRDIAPGEELTYDYLFDEDVREPCRSAPRHRRGYI